MKETIFDVLMYLFEHYMEDELEILPDSDSVFGAELLAAGFDTVLRSIKRLTGWNR